MSVCVPKEVSTLAFCLMAELSQEELQSRCSIVAKIVSSESEQVQFVSARRP